MREDDRVNAVTTPPAPIEVLVDDPRAKRILEFAVERPVSGETGHSRAECSPDPRGRARIDGNPVRFRRRPEHQAVDIEQASESRHGIDVIVHAQVYQLAGCTTVSSTNALDDQRRGLPAAAVASGSVPRLQRADQTIAQRQTDSIQPC